MKNKNNKLHSEKVSAEKTKNGVMTRGEAIKKVGIISLTAASMITLLASNKALAASVIRPDNPGSSGGF